MSEFRIGSRDSRLAVVQSELVRDYLCEHGIDARIITMKTTGDLILDRPLTKIGGKGLFVKELDRALLNGVSDLSVHSLKDVPVQPDARLPIVGYSKREDARDVLVLPQGVARLDLTKPIGCSSRRRILQAKRLLPGATFASVRGNVNTRLRKLDEGAYSALILAAAGLKRLGLAGRISRYFTVDEMIPSSGQGILALQGIAGRDYAALAGYCDAASELAARCERAFVQHTGGDCTAPVAAYAVLSGEGIVLRGMYAAADDTAYYVTGSIKGSCKKPEQLGRKLAAELMDRYQSGKGKG